MSRYRRSPRCTYCYTQGHTRRACPKMRADAAAAIAKPASERSYNDDRVIERASHYATANSGPRTCGYCNTSGHNVKGCTVRKNDINFVTDELVKWRKSFTKLVASAGCGIGAIIRHKEYISGIGYPNVGEYHYVMIVGVNTDVAMYWCCDGDYRISSLFRTRPIQNFDNRMSNIASPKPLQEALFKQINPDREYIASSYYDKMDVECASSAADFGADFAGYSTCRTIVENHFDLKRSKNKVQSRTDMIWNRVLPREIP